MRLRCYSSSALALALVASVAQAQVPGPASPGRLDDRFKTPVAPQSVPEITILATGQAAPPEQAAQSKFILTGVIIDGNTVYKPASLEPLYRALIGKEVSLLDIYKLRDALTAKYRADGYVLSQAIIPPQTIQGGVVHLQVVEGYISGVSLEGDTADRR
ncbi:MAG TPA: POTRA domain-containing protein, partial [Caulobacteraceae bacterium]|nr:POTRA domain-containing protein [Caulobacteraceae bacterium]